MKTAKMMVNRDLGHGGYMAFYLMCHRYVVPEDVLRGNDGEVGSSPLQGLISAAMTQKQQQ